MKNQEISEIAIFANSLIPGVFFPAGTLLPRLRPRLLPRLLLPRFVPRLLSRLLPLSLSLTCEATKKALKVARSGDHLRDGMLLIMKT